jgi:hypothetical protein
MDDSFKRAEAPVSAWALGRTTFQPRVRVPVSVKHAQNTDRRWKHFVVYGVGKATQEYTPETASNDRVTQGGFLDNGHRFVNRIEELLGSGRGSHKIPVERNDNLGPCDLANSKPTHLRELLPEVAPDV